MLAFVCGLCRWSANFASLFVVYYRIEQIGEILTGQKKSQTQNTKTVKLTGSSDG
jgi:hypothetical protein